MQISVCICESAASFFTTWKYTIYPSMSCPTNAGLWVIWVSLCRVVLGVTIGKLHQAGTVLFRCPKIRKSKYAWFRLRRSDVCVLNVPSGHIRTCAAVPGSTTLYCEQAYKDFLIFSQSHKTDPGLMRFASRKVVNHPSLENSFYNLGGVNF